MSDGNSLISLGNIGDLSKPATVLVQKICNAVGVVYEPTRIKRKARAELEVQKMNALGKIELSELERRAFERLAHQECRKQENIEEITTQAISSLPSNANVEGLDEDWVAHFFKQCDTVSDTEMQSLWGKLLAGEASAPGSFSKRTIDFVSAIDKREAKTFTSLCQFVWMMGEPTALVYDLDDPIYKDAGITFSALKHLDSIGLVSFESLSGYRRQGYGKYAHFFYYGKPVLVEFPADTGNEIQLGKLLLTSIGRELAPVCGSMPNPAFRDWVLTRWFGEGLILSSVLPN